MSIRNFLDSESLSRIANRVCDSDVDVAFAISISISIRNFLDSDSLSRTRIAFASDVDVAFVNAISIR